METSQILITPDKQAMVRIAGYEVLSICMANGNIGAGVRMICDLLGVDLRGQMRKLQADPAFRDSLVLAKVEIAGKQRAAYFIIAEFIPLWLKEIHPSKVAPEARETLAEFQRVAVQTLRAFFFPETKAQQQSAPPKEPTPTPLPTPDETALSLPETLQAVGMHIIQKNQQLETRLTSVEQENLELKMRLASLEQENQMLAARQISIDHQQMDMVAWMTEKGHELHLQAQQITAVTTRVEHLEASGETGVPQPSPERLHALRTMPYQEYLQTPEWQARRRLALRRAWYRCQTCNDTKMPLYVHHRTYERRGCEEPEDLFVLCASCHANYDPQFAAKRQK
ncbi:MAG TPA: phage antirepressor N-terminal domain-containing protein [Ktedonobacterales bacterium]|jgi:5-methylcytosine-specific restriction endonuclease McrA